MAIRTGKVIIASNILLDKEHKNILDYNEGQMLDLVNAHAVARSENCSFLRPNENTIETDFKYGDAIKCNYLALQNPEYSNKWFFAFIDSVDYISNGNARINYTIDDAATWFDYWNPKPCFVEREHVNDDTIGLHTYPENLEHGEYINVGSQNMGIGSCHIVVAMTEEYNSDRTITNIYNGIPNGLVYYLCQSFDGNSFLRYALSYAANKKDLSIIQAVFLVPDSLTGYNNISKWNYADTSGGLSYGGYANIGSSMNAAGLQSYQVAKKLDNINGYVPKNNKLFCWPYNFLVIDNNGGAAAEYRYEDFSSGTCGFDMKGDITPGCSIKLIPENFKGLAANYSEALNAIKLPIGSWQGDTYTNWLTQNGVNVGLSIAGSVGEIVAGAGLTATGAGAVAGVTSIAGGVTGIASTLNTMYQHSRIPNQVSGNINSGDVTYSIGQSTFTAYQRQIKREYAEIIDNFFTMFGYKINKIKVPNQKGRQNWNFVKIASGEILAYSNKGVPAEALTNINRIYESGTTVWHNHDNIGNYNLSNNII